MKGAPELGNVVEACNLEGRQERLDALLTQLELCEKALQACTHTRMRSTCLYMVPATQRSNSAALAGLPGDQARRLPALLLCGAGRPPGHPLQGLRPAAHTEVWWHELHAAAVSRALNQPQPSRRHLPKNFDNVHNLEFLKDSHGAPTTTAIGMYSGVRSLGRLAWVTVVLWMPMCKPKLQVKRSMWSLLAPASARARWRSGCRMWWMPCARR